MTPVKFNMDIWKYPKSPYFKGVPFSTPPFLVSTCMLHFRWVHSAKTNKEMKVWNQSVEAATSPIDTIGDVPYCQMISVYNNLRFISYCWWKKSCTTCNVYNLVNNDGINYQPQLVSRISEPSTALPIFKNQRVLIPKLGGHEAPTVTVDDLETSENDVGFRGFWGDEAIQIDGKL